MEIISSDYFRVTSYFDYLPQELLYIISSYMGLKYLKIYNSSYLNESLNKVYQIYLQDVKNGRLESFKKINKDNLQLFDHSQKEFICYSMINKKVEQPLRIPISLKHIMSDELKKFEDLNKIIYLNYCESIWDSRSKKYKLIYMLKDEYVFYQSIDGLITIIHTKEWNPIWDILFPEDRNTVILFNSI